MAAITNRTNKEDAAVYLRAAIRMSRPSVCGCCEAMDGETEKSFKRFARIFRPRMAPSYWWGDCCCPMQAPETRGPRILAFCFMAAMVEAGDA